MSEITPDAPAQVAREAVQEILRLMEFPATVEVEETEEQLLLTLTSEQPMGMLIGKGGQTLNALEMILARIVQNKIPHLHKRVIIDAEGYRQRQTERLEEIARAAAQKVLESGEPVELEPMSARDRRTVHTVLTGIEGIATYSVDEDPYRRVVVCLPGQEKAE